MYWFDILIIALCLIGALLGAFSGFVRQLARLLGILLALYATIVFNDWATVLLQRTAVSELGETGTRITAYIAVFLVVFLGIWFLGRYLHRAVKAAHLDGFDRLLGSIFGAFKMLLLSAAISVGLAFIPYAPARNVLKESQFAPRLLDGVHTLLSAAPANQRGALQQGIDKARQTATESRPKDTNK